MSFWRKALKKNKPASVWTAGYISSERDDWGELAARSAGGGRTAPVQPTSASARSRKKFQGKGEIRIVKLELVCFNQFPASGGVKGKRYSHPGFPQEG